MKIIKNKTKRRNLPRIVVEVESGQAIVILALAIVALIGFTAVAIDGGNAFFIRRNMQNAADGAVVAGIQSWLGALETSADEEQAIMLAAHTAAERNEVIDSDGSASNCVDDNVYVWYINDAGEALNPNTGASSSHEPFIGDDLDIQTVRANTDCDTLGTPPDGFDGIQVTTRREFDTFLAGIIGQYQMAAEGSAAAIVSWDENGCGGDFAIFSLKDSGDAIKLTGINPAYEIAGDIYAAGDISMTGSGMLLVDGTVRYSGSIDVSTGTDLWIGPEGSAVVPIPDGGPCPIPFDTWTFFDTGIQGDVCYDAVNGYEPPTQIPALDQPFTYDFAEWDKGGTFADEAAGCDTTNAGCQTGTTALGNVTFERWGNDYYYYNGGTDWNPNGATVPEGIYYLASSGVQCTGTTTFGQEISIIAPDTSNGGMTFTCTISAPPSDTLLPYGILDGSGVLFGSGFDNLGSAGNAISLSAGPLYAEGFIYAPAADCQVSGNTAISGALLCELADYSGSTGTMTFNPAYCPPPRPNIIFRR